MHVAEEITTGRISRVDLAARGRLVGELARALEMTSICGLGMVAAKPLETTLAFFRDDVERHLAANTAGGAP